MDPLTAIGLLATIAQLVDASAKVIRYISDARNAPKESLRFAQEASNILGLLLRLRGRVEDPQTPDAWFVEVNALSSYLDQLHELLEGLSTKIQSNGGRLQKVNQTLFWTFTKREINETLDTIERIKSLISLALEDNLLTLASAIKSDVAPIKGISVGVKQIGAGVHILQGSIDAQEARVLKQRQETLVQHISPFDFSAKQNDVFARRQLGTGQWFLDSPEYQEWVQTQGSTLWCSGIPGAGKTTLVSIVVDYLQQHFRKDGSTAILYVYCDYREKQNQSSTNLIASLWKQLIEERSLDASDCSQLEKDYVHRKLRPRLDEISKMLYSEMRRYSRTLIVVDALDECQYEYRKSFLGAIKSLQPLASLLVTSRFMDEEIVSFGHASTLQIKASMPDLREYARGRIDCESRLSEHVRKDPNLMTTIEQTVGERSQGMFLLAKLHMDSLVTKHTPKTVRKALAALPQGPNVLTKTYDEAMLRIEGQNADDKLLAERILAWICYANSPLTVQQLQYAVSIDEGDEELDEEDLIPGSLLTTVCAGLVTVDLQSRAVRFVHHTAQEYFETIRTIRFPYAQNDMAKTCLTYLRFPAFELEFWLNRKEFTERLYINPFVKYAASHWGDHVRESSSPDVIEDALGFLSQRGNLASAIQILAIFTLETSRLGSINSYTDTEQIPVQVKSLNVAAYFGLTDIVRDMVEESSALATSEDPMVGNALHWASIGNHEDTLHLLLGHSEASTVIDAYNQRRQTALHVSIIYSRREAVQLLLSYGADVLICRGDQYHFSSLRYAIEEAPLDIVATILEADKDRKLLMTPDIWQMIPMQNAAMKNYASALELLLKYHEEVYGERIFDSMADMHGENPLHSAAAKGSCEAARILLQHKLSGDLLWSRAMGRITPFHLAVTIGGPDVTRVFLEVAGSDKLLKKEVGQPNILQSAAQRGQASVVELLLEYASPDVYVDHGGLSIVHCATTSGSIETLRAVLRKDEALKLLDARDSEGMTALHAAVLGGHRELTKELISHNADVDAQDSTGLTPLHMAAGGGFDQIVSVLLEAGSDINKKSEQGTTALETGLGGRWSKSVKIILQAGDSLPSTLDEETKAWAATQPWWPQSQGQSDAAMELFMPESPHDVFQAAFYLKAASGFSTPLVNKIMDTAEYWILSNDYRFGLVRVVERDASNLIYLESQPIIGRPTRPVKQIIFTTRSHDQGWSDQRADHGTYNGSYTWFEAGAQRGTVRSSGPRILTNVHAKSAAITHDVAWPRREGFHWQADGDGREVAEWLAKLQPGDRVLVIPKAAFAGWVNNVLGAEISLYTTCLREF